jgi:putative transposase
MDFVACNLFDGCKLRMLTVVYGFTRESLAIDVDQSMKGDDVVHVLSRIVSEQG